MRLEMAPLPIFIGQNKTVLAVGASMVAADRMRVAGLVMTRVLAASLLIRGA
jgi:hypothetical protein